MKCNVCLREINQNQAELDVISVKLLRDIVTEIFHMEIFPKSDVDVCICVDCWRKLYEINDFYYMVLRSHVLDLDFGVECEEDLMDLQEEEVRKTIEDLLETKQEFLDVDDNVCMDEMEKCFAEANTDVTDIDFSVFENESLQGESLLDIIESNLAMTGTGHDMVQQRVCQRKHSKSSIDLQQILESCGISEDQSNKLNKCFNLLETRSDSEVPYKSAKNKETGDFSEIKELKSVKTCVSKSDLCHDLNLMDTDFDCQPTHTTALEEVIVNSDTHASSRFDIGYEFLYGTIPLDDQIQLSDDELTDSLGIDFAIKRLEENIGQKSLTNQINFAPKKLREKYSESKEKSEKELNGHETSISENLKASKQFQIVKTQKLTPTNAITDSSPTQVIIKYNHFPILQNSKVSYPSEKHLVPVNSVNANKTNNLQAPKPPKPKFICDFCNKTINSKDALKQHMHLKHLTKLVTCEKCNKQLSPSSVYMHNKVQHAPSLDVKCPICHIKLKHERVLQEHLRKSHKILNEKKVPRGFERVCAECGRMFTNKNTYYDHIRTKHRKNKEAPRPKCEICESTFSRRYLLAQHIERLHTKPRMCCPICQKVYLDENALTEHVERHITGINYTCSKCNKIYTNKYSLDNHNKTIHPKNPAHAKSQQCLLCFKWISNDHAMKVHLRKKHKIYSSDKRNQDCGDERAKLGPVFQQFQEVILQCV